MVRSELREHIFKMIFQVEFNSMEDMPEHLRLYFEQLSHAKDSDLVYIQEKYQKIVDKLPEIDNLLNEKTTGWKTGRMNKVDLSILRLAVYEILWDEDVPQGVAINEAVELAKVYGNEKDASYVNGVLSSIAKSMDGAAQNA